MGSTTGGLAVMGFGISGGSTWKDEECVRRLNARELANTLGEKDAAKELLCGNQEINAVYESLGRPCLMRASNSNYRPGGALINNRPPVQPRERASHSVPPVVTQVTPPPVVIKKIGDESDLDETENQSAIEKAEQARLLMKSRGY